MHMCHGITPNLTLVSAGMASRSAFTCFTDMEWPGMAKIISASDSHPGTREREEWWSVSWLGWRVQ